MIDYLETEYQVVNRLNKSKLAIESMIPEKLLRLANPNEVKHMWLDLSYSMDSTLCKDLVNFKYLETLYLQDVNLKPELWIEFAKNSECLKKITFTSGNEWDMFEFDKFQEEPKICEALTAIFQIPTLEEMTICCIAFPFFPKGPSNLEYIELDRIRNNEDDYIDEYIDDSYPNNFHTHTNLREIKVYPGKFSDFRFHLLPNLEKLVINGCYDEEDYNSLLMVVDLPNLKRLKLRNRKVLAYNGDKNELEQLKMKINLLKSELECRRPIKG